MIAAALIASAAVVGCSWDHPGANPYRGPIVQSVKAAVARYGLPVETQYLLVEKARTLDVTATVVITREGIESHDGVATNLRDMHYGKGRICKGEVLRTRWADQHAETALVYCARGECIAIPTICGNVSRIDFTPAAVLGVRGERDDLPRFWQGRLPMQHNTVPSPSTVSLVLLALAVTLIVRRHR